MNNLVPRRALVAPALLASLVVASTSCTLAETGERSELPPVTISVRGEPPSPPSSHESISHAPRPLSSRSSGGSPPRHSNDAIITRVDVSVGGEPLVAAFANARVAPAVLELLDGALESRFDLYAAAADVEHISIWLRDEDLVGFAIVTVNGDRLDAAIYDGPLAPPGFYDRRGFSLDGEMRARPVALSRVTSKFGDRFDPLTGRARRHRGLDYAVPVGTPVFAVGDGIVRARGMSRTGGNFIELAHARGFVSRVMHLSSFAPGTEVGARVSKNDVIARSGNTGRSTGPHVHYELLLAGEALDPERPAPLPTSLSSLSESALGPMALREHRAFLKQLQAMEAER